MNAYTPRMTMTVTGSIAADVRRLMRSTDNYETDSVRAFLVAKVEAPRSAWLADVATVATAALDDAVKGYGPDAYRAGGPNPPLSRPAPRYSINDGTAEAYHGGPEPEQQAVIAADVQGLFDSATSTPAGIRTIVSDRAKAGFDAFAESAARLIDDKIASEEKIRGFTEDANAAMVGRRPVVTKGNKDNKGIAL